MADPTPIEDGTIDFSGGQDASASPDKIGSTCIAAGINVSTQNRILTPRPGFRQLPLQLPSGSLQNQNRVSFQYDTIFESGRFQALIPYSVGSEFYLVAVISGVIFLINQRTYEISVIEIEDGSHINENLPRVNWSAAGKFLVIFDFPAFPVILEGTYASRARQEDFEVPVARMGAYNQNRLFIGNNGNAFTGGDPTGNLATPDAPITFEEVLAQSSAYRGQVFLSHSNYANSPISAMTFLQYTDTGTGIGPLLVATDREIYSYQTQLPRAQWDVGAFGTAFISNAGIAGGRSFVNVNSDVFFVSRDGQLRTASMSRQEQQKWSKVPLSREVKNWLKYWDPELTQYAVLGYFDNKILLSANPFRVPSYGMFGNFITDIAFGGIVVIELDNISKLAEDSAPVWSGLWTGIRPTEICVNNDRCFIASKDGSYINHIYEVSSDFDTDIIGGIERQIRSIVYTKAYDFQSPFQDKQLHTADLQFQNTQGNFKVDLKYKPSHAPKFIKWKSFEHKAPTMFCTNPNSCEVLGLLGQSFRQLTFGAPDTFECDPVTEELYRAFRKIQLKLVIEGRYWELHELKIRATAMPMNYYETVCKEYKVAELCGECNDDWAIPEISLCQT